MRFSKKFLSEISLEQQLGIQLNERKLEAGQNVFAFERVALAQEAVGFGGALNEGVALSGVDDPREAGAAFEVVAQLFGDTERAVCGRDDLDCEIRRAAEKSLAGLGRARHSCGRDEAEVGTAQISGAHPAAEIWAADDSQAVLGRVRADVSGEGGAEMGAVHVGASQAKFIVHQLAFAAVVREAHQLVLGPSRGGGVPHAGKRARATG